MAISTLVRLSEDKITRQEYLRRQDDILLQNRKNRRLTELETENERLRKELSKLQAEKSNMT